MTPPGGLGPYFCSLFFNTSSKCKKQTHLAAHTYPHLIQDRMNSQIIRGSDERKRERQEDEECWVQILKVGPFQSWNQCKLFLSTWIDKTRGKKRRLERGVELARQYQKHIWVQDKARDDVVKQFYQDIASVHFDEEVEEEKEEEKQVPALSHEIFAHVLSHPAEAIPIKTVKEIHVRLDPSKKKKSKK